MEDALSQVTSQLATDVGDHWSRASEDCQREQIYLFERRQAFSAVAHKLYKLLKFSTSDLSCS